MFLTPQAQTKRRNMEHNRERDKRKGALCSANVKEGKDKDGSECACHTGFWVVDSSTRSQLLVSQL